MNVVGPQVRQLRETQRMAQEGFTARCNIVGLNISRSTLAKIESQVRKVTDNEVALLAKAQGFSGDALQAIILTLKAWTRSRRLIYSIFYLSFPGRHIARSLLEISLHLH